MAFILAAIASLMLYHTKGNTKVLTDGTLAEPFYLMGLAGILIILALVSALSFLCWDIYKAVFTGGKA